uniref:RING-H2 finger protein ATL16-like n=1 Tax=Erigeron canadensis TaxID=72917 RepID=UPI001CB9651D|nr:RING-H2 finger protein ATL16-like [Erigeron canadensis]
MALSPVPSPGLKPSKWSPIVIAMVGTMGTLFLIFSYFNVLRRCSFRSLLSSRNDQRRRLSDANREGNDSSLHFQSRGIDSFTVQMIPVTPFKKTSEAGKVNNNQGDDHQSSECAICLGEYEDDEWVKTIPSCNHIFHVSCIDTWFQTHSNCPLCRSDVFDHLDVSVSTCDSLGRNLIREDVDEDRSAFYQSLRSHILQNSNLSRLA